MQNEAAEKINELLTPITIEEFEMSIPNPNP